MPLRVGLGTEPTSACSVQVFIDPETLNTISPFEYCANLASDAGLRQESTPAAQDQTHDGALTAGGCTPDGQDRRVWSLWMGGRSHVHSDERNLRERSMQDMQQCYAHISTINSIGMVAGGSHYTDLAIEVVRARTKRDNAKLKSRKRDPVNVCPRGCVPGYKDTLAPICLVSKCMLHCSKFNFLLASGRLRRRFSTYASKVRLIRRRRSRLCKPRF